VSDHAWKAFERRTARDHGVERTPVSGRQADTGGLDWSNQMFAAQVKLGYNEPGYLRTWVDGIRRHAQVRGLVGIVIWKHKWVRDENALVILRYADWLELHGQVEDGLGLVAPEAR